MTICHTKQIIFLSLDILRIELYDILSYNVCVVAYRQRRILKRKIYLYAKGDFYGDTNYSSDNSDYCHCVGG